MYKWKKKTLLIIMVISIVLSGCQMINTNNNKEYSKTIVVGIDDYSPYTYRDTSGKYKGIDVELARAAFHKLGYEVKFKKVVWENKNEDLDAGNIDCIWSCYSMDDRESLYQWAGPYLHSD